MDRRLSISLEDALARILARVKPLEGVERVPLLEAPGRVLGSDLSAGVDLPPFHRSPLDGYALRAADTAGCSGARPAVLAVRQLLFAGSAPAGELRPGECARIMTGAPIPAGCDCVVRQEDTDGGEETVQVYCALSPHQNFCFQGEEVRAGTPILSRGKRLDWTHVGILAAQGLGEVDVRPVPKVAVLATGDELTETGGALAPGKIYDSNGPMLSARLAALHARPVLLGRGGDEPEALAQAVRTAAGSCQLVLTSGGVSVGQKDFMPRVAKSLHGEVLFHGVDAKPGMPTLAMVVDGTPVICLSGNPFAAAAMLELLARPAVERLAGCTALFPRRCTARLHGSFPKASPTRRLVRARLEGGEVFVEGSGHASGMVLGLMDCSCLVDIPAHSPALDEGAMVDVFVL